MAVVLEQRGNQSINHSLAEQLQGYYQTSDIGDILATKFVELSQNGRTQRPICNIYGVDSFDTGVAQIITFLETDSRFQPTRLHVITPDDIVSSGEKSQYPDWVVDLSIQIGQTIDEGRVPVVLFNLLNIPPAEYHNRLSTLKYFDPAVSPLDGIQVIVVSRMPVDSVDYMYRRKREPLPVFAGQEELDTITLQNLREIISNRAIVDPSVHIPDEDAFYKLIVDLAVFDHFGEYTLLYAGDNPSVPPIHELTIRRQLERLYQSGLLDREGINYRINPNIRYIVEHLGLNNHKLASEYYEKAIKILVHTRSAFYATDIKVVQDNIGPYIANLRAAGEDITDPDLLLYIYLHEQLAYHQSQLQQKTS